MTEYERDVLRAALHQQPEDVMTPITNAAPGQVIEITLTFVARGTREQLVKELETLHRELGV